MMGCNRRGRTRALPMSMERWSHLLTRSREHGTRRDGCEARASVPAVQPLSMFCTSSCTSAIRRGPRILPWRRLSCAPFPHACWRPARRSRWWDLASPPSREPPPCLPYPHACLGTPCWSGCAPSIWRAPLARARSVSCRVNGASSSMAWRLSTGFPRWYGSLARSRPPTLGRIALPLPPFAWPLIGWWRQARNERIASLSASCTWLRHPRRQRERWPDTSSWKQAKLRRF